MERLIAAALCALFLLSGSCAPLRGTAPGGSGPASDPAAPGPPVAVDDFERPDEWSAHPADGVELALGTAPGGAGSALRLDFHFVSGGGYAVARRDVDLDLPENYALSFRMRGDAPANHLELKLIDATGENVWWHVWREVDFPAEWTTFRIKKRGIRFAWGPLGGGEIRHVAAIELAITAGNGGRGTVWIDDLKMTPLPPAGAPLPDPVALASSSAPGRGPELALDGDPATSWQPDSADATPWLALDFGGPREFGGLTVDWAEARGAGDYVVETSGDAAAWSEIHAVTGGNGGRDDLFLPESESRYVRVRCLPAGAGPLPVGLPPAVAAVRVHPLEWSATREAFFEAIAQDAPRGTYPRGFSGEQVFWTVVGADNDPSEGLLSEDGALEIGPWACSVEPFLWLGDRLVTWADANATQWLDEGVLPIPSVQWDTEPELTVTAFTTGPPGAASIVGRYRVRSRSADPADVTLYLAVRPFQVNPPTQALNRPGGTSRIHQLEGSRASLENRGEASVNGVRAIVCISTAHAFGAVPFAGGDIVDDYLRRGVLPPETAVEDPFGAASGAFAFPMRLDPGSEREFVVVLPLTPESVVEPGIHTPGRCVEQKWWESQREWRPRVLVPGFALPESADHALQTWRAQIGYILVNRAGPGIQPGARSYARSWIRDGALTSTALLRTGHAEAVREFIEWYAPHQFENGKIPCVVDFRGADPVPEHDSSGEFIFLVAEYFRYTGDGQLVGRLWPRVRRAADYLDALRQERRTAEFRTPENAPFFGILPPSISHEGYSAKPMHSYWDDFFAWRGFRDAAFLAETLGLAEENERLAGIRDEFSTDLCASIQAAMEQHGIDYVPGCADLGDFDATSTTIALSPVQAEDVLPSGAAEQTFERYWKFFRARRDGAPWDAFTPYEIRNIGAFVRLGWRDRAHELMDWFLSQQRPPGWRQWPEVVYAEERVPRFLGDLPHTWVGSDFVRSFLDFFVYWRDFDQSLVVGAGVPLAWLESPGVHARGLSTPYGPLDLSMSQGRHGLVISVGGDVRVPPGGIVLKPPLPAGAGAATLDGRAVAFGADGELVVHRLPATVVISLSVDPPSD